MEYEIRRAKVKPKLDGNWDGEAWAGAQTAQVKFFSDKGSSHRPVTHFRVVYDDDGIHVLFRVRDQYVRSVQTKFQSQVCTDSCVEAFLEPKAGFGYFNFEVNCGGTLLCYYIEDPTIHSTKGGFTKWTKIPDEQLRLVKIFHSMPSVVRTEITEPTEWRIEYFVPYEFFENYVGPLEAPGERRWRGNFYKCGDQTSHRHWASWSPIGKRLNFHQPEFFAPVRFEAPTKTKKRRTPRLQTA